MLLFVISSLAEKSPYYNHVTLRQAQGDGLKSPPPTCRGGAVTSSPLMYKGGGDETCPLFEVGAFRQTDASIRHFELSREITLL